MDGNGYLFGRNRYGQIGDGNTGQAVRRPFKINDCINDTVVDGSCGDRHTILLTGTNNVITFGENYCNQCSSRDDENISTPYIVSKTDEIGISSNAFVEKVMAINEATLIFIDRYKTAN